MTYQEIIDTVKIETKRSQLESSLILTNIETLKAEIIHYEFVEKMKIPSDNFFQTFDNIPVEIVEKTKFGTEGLVILPLKSLDGLRKIKYFGDSSKHTEFVEKDSYKWIVNSLNSQYPSKKPHFCYEPSNNNRTYRIVFTKEESVVTHVKITNIFSRPYELPGVNFENDIYPIPDFILQNKIIPELVKRWK